MPVSSVNLHGLRVSSCRNGGAVVKTARYETQRRILDRLGGRNGGAVVKTARSRTHEALGLATVRTAMEGQSLRLPVPGGWADHAGRGTHRNGGAVVKTARLPFGQPGVIIGYEPQWRGSR